MDDLADYRAEWESVIARLVARAWADPDFKAALLVDARPHLHGAGLLFPDRYVVEFYDDIGAQPGDWHSIGRGSRALHRFPIPPPPDGTDVTTLGNLDATTVACCSPCASCTGAVSPATWG